MAGRGELPWPGGSRIPRDRLGEADRLAGRRGGTCARKNYRGEGAYTPHFELKGMRVLDFSAALAGGNDPAARKKVSAPESCKTLASRPARPLGGPHNNR